MRHANKSYSRLVLISFFYSLLVSVSCAQVRAIKISHSEKSKVIIVKENRRIRIKLNSGKKISGRFKIIDENTIRIRETTVSLSDIVKIKRHPVLLQILTSAVMYAAGGAAVLVAVLSTPDGLPALLIAATAVYGITTGTNILKAYKVSKQWIYEIITLK